MKLINGIFAIFVENVIEVTPEFPRIMEILRQIIIIEVRFSIPCFSFALIP